jgi:REP element-mobilizing transposase RayT
VIEIEVMRDHAHRLVQIAPTVALPWFVQLATGRSASMVPGAAGTSGVAA